MMDRRSDISVSSRPIALVRMVSAKTADRARPSLLARYMAASASLSRTRGWTDAEVASAMPALTDMTSSPPSQPRGSVIAAQIRSATLTASCFARQCLAEHDEFVAADAGEGVAGTDEALEPGRHRQQQLIADGWPRLSLITLNRSMSR